MCSLKTGGGAFAGPLGGNVEVPIKQELPEISNAPSQMTYFQAFEGEYLKAKGKGSQRQPDVGSNTGPSTSWF